LPLKVKLNHRAGEIKVRHLVGIILVALSAAGFGTFAIFGRYAYADGIDAITILFFRFSLAAMLILALLIVRRERLPSGSALIRLIGMGAIGYVGQTFAYLIALKHASAGLVALLFYLYPIFVLLLSAFLLHEPITGAKWLALGLAMVGTAFAAGPASGHMLGILLAISAAAIYSVYILVGSQVMMQVSPVQSSAVILSSAGVMSGVLMVVKGPHLPVTGVGWAAIISIVLISTVLPVVAFLSGLKRIGPTNTAMVSTLEPVVTVGLATLLLNETLKPLSLLGGGLILAGVLWLTQSELRRTEQALTSKPSRD
jgi:drug/metabolite transporter (DMT)-like permease